MWYQCKFFSETRTTKHGAFLRCGLELGRGAKPREAPWKERHHVKSPSEPGHAKDPEQNDCKCSALKAKLQPANRRFKSASIFAGAFSRPAQSNQQKSCGWNHSISIPTSPTSPSSPLRVGSRLQAENRFKNHASWRGLEASRGGTNSPSEPVLTGNVKPRLISLWIRVPPRM